MTTSVPLWLDPWRRTNPPGDVLGRLQYAWQELLKTEVAHYRREVKAGRFTGVPEDAGAWQAERVVREIMHIAAAALGAAPEFDRAARGQGGLATPAPVVLDKLTSVFEVHRPWGAYLPWVAANIARDARGTAAALRNLSYVGRLLTPRALDRLHEWLKATRRNYNAVSLKDAVEEALAGPEGTDSQPTQGEIVYTYADGYTIQALTTKEQLNDEGEWMSHCVGSYYEEVKEARTKIFSLRDKKGRPHVTIEIKKGRVKQVQAKGNEFPNKHVGRLLEVAETIFAGDPTWYLKLNVLNKAPKWALEALAQDKDVDVHWALAGNPAIAGSPEVVAALTEDTNAGVRQALARNPAIAGSPEVVAALAKDVNMYVRWALAGNPAIAGSPEVAATLAKDVDMYVRRDLARNPATASFPKVVATLEKDVDANVRQALAGNKALKRQNPRCQRARR